MEQKDEDSNIRRCSQKTKYLIIKHYEAGGLVFENEEKMILTYVLRSRGSGEVSSL